MDFKVETIAMPESPPIAPKRRGRPPGSKNKPRVDLVTGETKKRVKCSNSSHIWETVGSKDGYTLERCIKCRDVFPCEDDSTCHHTDCKETKHLPLPDWYLENLAGKLEVVENPPDEEIPSEIPEE